MWLLKPEKERKKREREGGRDGGKERGSEGQGDRGNKSSRSMSHANSLCPGTFGVYPALLQCCGLWPLMGQAQTLAEHKHSFTEVYMMSGATQSTGDVLL